MRWGAGFIPDVVHVVGANAGAESFPMQTPVERRSRCLGPIAGKTPRRVPSSSTSSIISTHRPCTSGRRQFIGGAAHQQANRVETGVAWPFQPNPFAYVFVGMGLITPGLSADGFKRRTTCDPTQLMA